MTKLQSTLANTWKKTLLGIGPATVFVLYLGDLIQGRFIVSRDTTSFLYVIRRWYTDRILTDDSLPHWLEGLFSGMNIHTDPQLGLFSPFIWLYFVFDGYLAHQLYTLLILALGSLGMGLYIHRLFDHRALAAFLGLLYVACGLVFSGVHNTVFLIGMCLLPWVLWRYECLRQEPSLSNSLWLSLSIAWVVFEGDGFACFWCCSYVFLDAVVKCVRAKQLCPLIGWVILAGGVALIITAVVWLPPIETMAGTRRATVLPFEQTSYFSTHPIRLLNFIAPSLWGWHHDGTFWGHAHVHPQLPFSKRFWHDAIYMSIPLLCLFFVAVFQSFRQKQHRLKVIMALVFVLIALGDHFFLHKILYDYFPYYGKLRFPAKFLTYAHVFIFVLAAWGLWRLYQKMRSGNWIALNRFLAILAGTYLLAFGLCIVFSGSPEESGQLTKNSLAMAQDRLTTNAVLSFLFGLGCLGGGFASRMAVSNKGNVARLQWGGICVLILVELLLWLPPIRTEPSFVFDKPQRLENILRSDGNRGHIKILRDANIDRFSGQRRSLAGRESLRHNWAILRGMSYVFGYEPTVPARFDNLSGPSVFRRLEIWLETLGITHILSTVHPSSTQLRLLTEQGRLQIVAMLQEENIIVLRPSQATAYTRIATEIKLVSAGDQALLEMQKKGHAAEVAIVENNAYLSKGKIRLDPDPIREIQASLSETRSFPPNNTSIKNVVKANNRIEIELDTDRPALLIIKEGFQPGWHAHSQGKDLAILRADFINMAVRVESGSSKVIFEYHPRMLTLASMPTLGGLFLVFSILLAQALFRWFRKNNPRLR